MTTLKEQTVSGIKWLVGSSFLQKAIQLAGTVILARILGPSQFGLFALAFVAIDALSLFKSMGFDSALIQKKDNIEKAANTAFFIIPVLGIVLYLILFISAPLIGKFLNNEGIIPIVRALGIIFVISCLGKVPASLMEKYMQFKQVSIIEIGTAIIYSTSAVIFAILKFGVWSLVYAYILKTIFQNILTFIYAKWWPKFEFDKKIALEMFHFGKFLFLSGVVWFLKMNLDNILVGKILGVTALGLYAIAFNIANFGADYFGNKVYRVIYPVYSKIQEDVSDLRIAFLKLLKYLSLFAFPFCVVLVLLSGDILKFIYGDKWSGASSVLKILAWVGLFNTLPAGMGGIFLALGKPRLGFWIVLLQTLIFVIFITPFGKLFGLNGVGLVVSFASVIALFIGFVWIIKLIKLTIRQILESMKLALITTAILSLIIIVIKEFSVHFFIEMNSYKYIAEFFLVGLAYVLTVFFYEKSVLKEIKEMLI